MIALALVTPKEAETLPFYFERFDPHRNDLEIFDHATTSRRRSTPADVDGLILIRYEMKETLPWIKTMKEAGTPVTQIGAFPGGAVQCETLKAQPLAAH